MVDKQKKNKSDYKLGSKCNSGNRKIKSDVSLKIDGKETKLVPFVQNLIRNNVLAVVQELDGYSDDARIEITIK